MADTRRAPVTNRVLTVPNLLSLLRLAGVPLFLWLLLGPRADGWALAVYGPFRVTYLGKSATFLLLYAFPLLLLGVGTSPIAPLCRPFGYAFAAWGAGLYLYSGLLYLVQVAHALYRPPPADGVPPGGGGPVNGR